MDIHTLKTYKNDSYIKTFKHSKASSYYKKINTVFSILNIGLVSLSGIAANISHNDFYNGIISGVLYFSLFITGIQKYLNYEELSSKHGSSSLGYSLLYKNIRDNLTEPSIIYITQFQVLDSISPTIPDHIEAIQIEMPDDKPNSIISNKTDNSIVIELERLKNL